MSTSAKQKVQQAELHKKLWSIANDLRGTMDASEFRNYILGLIFYRYLSEKAFLGRPRSCSSTCCAPMIILLEPQAYTSKADKSA